MRLAQCLRILLALLLLNAQHAALAHQAWHAGDKSGPPSQQQLCDMHEALGTVAGALDCAGIAPVAVAPAGFFVSRADLAAVCTPGRAPSSRGPPVLL